MLFTALSGSLALAKCNTWKSHFKIFAQLYSFYKGLFKHSFSPRNTSELLHYLIRTLVNCTGKLSLGKVHNFLKIFKLWFCSVGKLIMHWKRTWTITFRSILWQFLYMSAETRTTFIVKCFEISVWFMNVMFTKAELSIRYQPLQVSYKSKHIFVYVGL